MFPGNGKRDRTDVCKNMHTGPRQRTRRDVPAWVYGQRNFKNPKPRLGFLGAFQNQVAEGKGQHPTK